MQEQTSNVVKKKVTFQCGSLTLEGILHTVDQPQLRPAVVVCHPHPLYGGTMHNRLVVYVCEELANAGITALRFNFRGVEASQGMHGGGVDEIEDVRAAVTFIASLPSSETCCLGVAGYSFGAHTGLQAAVGDERVSAVAAISPAIAVNDFSFLREYKRPKLLLAGEHDEFVPREEFVTLVEALPEPKQFDILSYADHFWVGFERRVAVKVATFFKDALS